MFDIRDPKTSDSLMKGTTKLIQNIIDGCALLFAIMIIGLIAGLSYFIYVICTT
jgi:hypothetical protein